MATFDKFSKLYLNYMVRTFHFVNIDMIIRVRLEKLPMENAENVEKSSLKNFNTTRSGQNSMTFSTDPGNHSPGK